MNEMFLPDLGIKADMLMLLLIVIMSGQNSYRIIFYRNNSVGYNCFDRSFYREIISLFPLIRKKYDSFGHCFVLIRSHFMQNIDDSPDNDSFLLEMKCYMGIERQCFLEN